MIKLNTYLNILSLTVSSYKFCSNLSILAILQVWITYINIAIKAFILSICVLIESISAGGICEAVYTVYVYIMWSWAMPEARLKCCC